MSRILPAPYLITPGSGSFTLATGAGIAFADAGLESLVERFVTDFERRRGIRLDVTQAGSDAAAIRIGIGECAEFATLPETTGVSPLGDTIPDERYVLTFEEDGVELIAREPVGVARGLTSLLQVLTTSPDNAGGVTVPAQRIVDLPRYAWRGFSVDVARRFLTVRELERLIDLLALYKFNVLNLHLTEDTGWRLPFGRPDHAQDPTNPDDQFYTVEDLRQLDAYATERFVSLIPELDAPGHGTAIIKLRPELISGRNRVDFESHPGRIHVCSWFDPELPTTFPFLESVWGELADLFPGAYLNIGGDEPFGMPHDLYAMFMEWSLPFVRSLGKRTFGWQETVRAVIHPEHPILHWIAIPTEADLAQFQAHGLSDEVMKNLVLSGQDLETAVANNVAIIASPHTWTYLDVPYAEASADPDQAALCDRLGLKHYRSMTIAETLAWDPGTLYSHVDGTPRIAGTGAAIWGETINGFDDMIFLVMPRLAGNSEKGWSVPQATDWETHRDALAWHGRLWEQDGLTFFRSSLVGWN